ncbi:hypothetical protein KKC91_07045 [bacterium]|nr:hypothetical protein [bacterium]
MRQKKLVAFILFAFFAGLSSISFANDITLHYFYDKGCRNCDKADNLLSSFIAGDPYHKYIVGYSKKNRIKITKHNQELKDQVETRITFDTAYKVKHGRRLVCPAVFIGSCALVGKKEVFKLGEAMRDPGKCLPVCNTGGKEKLESIFTSISLPVVIFAGLLDGVNPCAITVLIFFISFLQVREKRGRNLAVFLFISGVFIAYLSFGLGIIKGINKFYSFRRIIDLVAVMLCTYFAIQSFFDYRKAKLGRVREMVLKTPERLNNIARRLIRNTKGAVIIALPLGIIISLLEFVCTGQEYVPTILYMLKTGNRIARAIQLLTVYNLAFVLPLILVGIACIAGSRTDRVTDFYRKHLATVKLCFCFFFTGLAIYLGTTLIN